jgi:hypothetical protein
VAIWEKVLGPDHPDLSIPLGNLGDVDNRSGDHAAALLHCQRAQAIEEARLAADHPDLAYGLTCIGEAQLGLGQPRRALPPLERALGLREGQAGDAGELARTRLALAQALWAAGSPADRARARRLATAARDGFATAGDAWKSHHATAVDWLAKHGAGG